jgi:hypothetical protein
MGRPRTTVAAGPMIVGLIVAAAVTIAAGCGADGSAEHPYEPTLPVVDFRPKLVLEVGDDGLRATAGERADPAVRTDPPSVPGGSVVEVRNTGSRDHRLRGGTTLDTGIMRPGEHTTAVVTNPGPDPLELALVDIEGDTSRGPLTVGPTPAPG